MRTMKQYTFQAVSARCFGPTLHCKSRRKIPLSTIIDKIFETNPSFHVKSGTTGKVQFVFFKRFMLVKTKFSFWEEGYNSIKF